MKNVFAENKGKGGRTTKAANIPRQFPVAAAKFVHILREDLGANEVRALAADKVASPVLQVESSPPLNLIVANLLHHFGLDAA